MDTPAEFRKHAADCKKMAKVSNERETKAAWKRMAERWVLCAKLTEDQDLFQRRRVEEKHSRPHRSPAPTERPWRAGPVPLPFSGNSFPFSNRTFPLGRRALS